MGEAAAAVTGETGDGREGAAVGDALEALRLAWGDTYMFGHDERGFWAARPDAPGTKILRAGTPQEMGNLLEDDFGSGSS